MSIYNIIDVCSETTSLHLYSFNSLLNTSLPAYTQLQFLTEHKSTCIYTASTLELYLSIRRCVSTSAVIGYYYGLLYYFLLLLPDAVKCVT